MRIALLGLAGIVLGGCTSEPVRAQKEPTVDQNLKLIEKQKEIPQASKDGIEQLVTAYKDKDEFENSASH